MNYYNPLCTIYGVDTLWYCTDFLNQVVGIELIKEMFSTLECQRVSKITLQSLNKKP